MPSLEDSNFEKSVVYICEHSEEGAMGLVINKPLQINLGNVLQHLDIQTDNKIAEDHPVLLGGPVGQEHGFIIHGDSLKNVEPFIDIVISSSKQLLRNIAQGEGPDDFIITLGYAGWSPGQLEEEITKNDWLVVPFDPHILFEVPIEKRWQETARLVGIDIHLISEHMGHA